MNHMIVFVFATTKTPTLKTLQFAASNSRFDCCTYRLTTAIKPRNPATKPVINTPYELCVVLIIVNKELQTGLPVVINDVTNPIMLKFAQTCAYRFVDT
jgi:hypothetical protein